MSSRSSAPSLAGAIVLGTLQGLTELLPVSSSGHVGIVAALLRSDRTDNDDPELRKAFEVALHAGSAAALLLSVRREQRTTARVARSSQLTLLGLAAAPPAIAGYLFERPIERRLGTPRSIAAALLAGALAMSIADGRPQRRARAEATSADALALGIAQALALVPGISRSGATLTAARLRRFTREDAARLSRETGVPVMIGATTLKALRLSRRGLARDERRPLALGAFAALLSTLGAARAVRLDRSLAPFAAYRAVLAIALLIRAHGSRSGGSPTIPA